MYKYELRYNSGGTIPYDGTTWVVDGENHYVEFPQGAPTGGPFTIDFYRYTGAVGYDEFWHYITEADSSVTICPDPSAAGYDILANFSTPAQSTEGVGSRMMFDMSKSAFRAGVVSSTQWDDSNRGIFSTAFGSNNTASGSSSSIGGGTSNVTRSANAHVGGGDNNVAGIDESTGVSSVIAGGSTNEAGGDYSTVGGGMSNVAGNLTDGGAYTHVGGGEKNKAIGHHSSIAGGKSNLTYGMYSTVSGGYSNMTADLGHYAAICGGEKNRAMGEYSLVAGGQQNHADGKFSFAAGRYAMATSDNSFVWSCGDAKTKSAGDKTFTASASGGTIFYSDVKNTLGVVLSANSSSWSAVSDINMKENLIVLDPIAVLHKLDDLPIYQYNYIGTPAGMVNRGPVAQDWHAAFPSPEKDPLRIDTMDPIGVALAAIKGLSQQVRDQYDQLRLQSDRITALESHHSN